ncbi:MAG: hypothetical protein P1Q69_15400 [Candidatus Thorarchaeota archaeon]|nr:hypothetical protein [Candidatus Thorarchaeota archaeon]
MSTTARDLLQKIAHDTGIPYREVAKRINKAMADGEGFIQSVQRLAIENGLKENDYSLNPVQIANEISKILKEDYSQTLMISAVLGQLVESQGEDRLPPPAFFVFLEILSDVTDTPRRVGDNPPNNVDESTTRIIELTTTLVSLICEWNETGVVGVSKDCPPRARDIARSVFRKTKLLQSGLWCCVSCGRIVEAKHTRALLCSECDSNLSDDTTFGLSERERTRSGYGRSSLGDELE